MPRMAPAVSQLARQTMRTAFEDLENTVSPVDLKQMRSVSAIQQVRDKALEIENQLAARQSLRNMRRLAPFFQGLEHYAKSIEVLSNGTPFLPWIWSPITLILKVASDHIYAFEQIIKGYSRISEALRRFEILSEALRHDATFQYSLAVYYSDILQFHKNAYKFVRRSGWHLLFNTSWGRFQRRFDGILQDLDRHGDLIDREANARNIAEAQRKRDESQDKVEQEEKHQTTKQYSSVISWLKVDDTEQIKVFESIHEEGSKYQGTCAWMTNNGKISSWLKNTPNDRLLWLQGNAGTGKSVMLTQLVTFLQISESTVIYHFCRDTYSASTRYENILKSLIQQILRSSGELAAYVYQEYVVDKKTTTTKNLERLLGNLLVSLSTARKIETVWIIIDSIEDCEPAKQAWLISLLYGLTAKNASHDATICKVLFSSRTLPSKAKRLTKKHILCLSDEMEHVSKAIKLYTSQRLRTLHGRLRQLEMSAEAIEHIEDLVTVKADGMFLYARLVLDYLSTNVFYSAEELEQSVHSMPSTVQEFYQKIVAQMLAHLDTRSMDRVRCVLGWIAFAKRPLNRLELLSALAFSSGRSDISGPAPTYLLELCGPLIHEKQDTTLAFIHGSVKEFLQSSPTALSINKQSALQEHGLATVACLLSGFEIFREDYDESKRLLRLVKGVHGLHVYSTEHWSEYILANAAAANNLTPWPNSLAEAIYRLTIELSQTTGSTVSSINSLDERLKMLDCQPNLQLHIAKALLARSQKSLEAKKKFSLGGSEDIPDNCSVKADLNDGVSSLLDAYQKAIEILLDQDSCPGASVEELRFFKSQFRSSAYTCRLRACPRATIGFESEESRHEHEIGHVGGYRCSTAGCQYPPFRTSQALRSHTGKHHNVVPARKSIRKVGRLPSDEFSNSPRVRTLRKMPPESQKSPYNYNIDRNREQKAVQQSAAVNQVQKFDTSTTAPQQNHRVQSGSRPGNPVDGQPIVNLPVGLTREQVAQAYLKYQRLCRNGVAEDDPEYIRLKTELSEVVKLNPNYIKGNPQRQVPVHVQQNMSNQQILKIQHKVPKNLKENETVDFPDGSLPPSLSPRNGNVSQDVATASPTTLDPPTSLEFDNPSRIPASSQNASTLPMVYNSPLDISPLASRPLTANHLSTSSPQSKAIEESPYEESFFRVSSLQANHGSLSNPAEVSNGYIQQQLQTHEHSQYPLPLLKCTCSNRNFSEGDLICHCCDTKQHKSCYERFSPIKNYGIHICIDCRPTRVMASLGVLNHSVTTRKILESELIFTFFDRILLESPRNYTAIINVFKSLNQAWINYEDFIHNVIRLLDENTVWICLFLQALAEASMHRMAVPFGDSQRCVYCYRPQLPITGLYNCFNDRCMNAFHHKCLFFRPVSKPGSSLCSACVLATLGFGEGILMGDLETDIIRAFTYRVNHMHSADDKEMRILWAHIYTPRIDSGEQVYNRATEHSNITTNSGNDSATAYPIRLDSHSGVSLIPPPALPGPLVLNDSKQNPIQGQLQLQKVSATPMAEEEYEHITFNTPHEGIDGDRSGLSREPTHTLPSMNPLDDWEGLASVLDIPKQRRMPSLRNILEFIRLSEAPHMRQVTRFIGLQVGTPSLDGIIVKILPAVALIANLDLNDRFKARGDILEIDVLAWMQWKKSQRIAPQSDVFILHQVDIRGKYMVNRYNILKARGDL